MAEGEKVSAEEAKHIAPIIEGLSEALCATVARFGTLSGPMMGALVANLVCMFMDHDDRELAGRVARGLGRAIARASVEHGLPVEALMAGMSEALRERAQ